MKNLTVLLMGVLLSAYGAAASQTIYVSPSGGIAGFEGVKVETVTLNTAVKAAKPGTVIQLTEGVYTGRQNIHLLATEAQPLVIRGLNEKTLYDGQKKLGDETYCLGIIKSAWIKIENLTFKSCWVSPIVIDNSSYLTFNNLYAESSRFMVFAQGEQTHHLLLENSTWIQDPTGSVWHSLPWAESHHGRYKYFNGGMFSRVC